MTMIATRFRCASPDPLRCRYTDCIEQHPAAPDSLDDGIEEAEEERITCPSCRRDMGLPDLSDEERAAARKGQYLTVPRLENT
jgi:hypothetical protein